MLSILIPVYNYPVANLIQDLYKQCKILGEFEIIVVDDASSAPVEVDYEKAEKLEGVRIIRNKENLGRSKTRNLLAQTAIYENLLFIDCDAKVCSPTYIKDYIDTLSKADVICGGTGYSELPPKNKQEYFRWKYGSQREKRSAEIRNKVPDQSFSSFNFLIKKTVFLSIQFDETITNYGHEDTLFGIQLHKKGHYIFHIDNPILHTGLETGESFLQKTEIGIETLLTLLKDEENAVYLTKSIHLLSTFQSLKSNGFVSIISCLFSLTKPLLRSIILSTTNLFFFDIYKLGYLCRTFHIQVK